jgi:ATP-binding protein involved in chromosome partitioning
MALSDQKTQQQLQDTEISETLGHIKNKILVMSGKGGVGKSSVAAYLAASLAKRGHRVGLMDVDLHGPSIPGILGLKGGIQPGAKEGKARPVEYIPNMEVISIASLMREDQKDAATIWRGPLKIGVIRQFIADIEWQDLDYMIIDSPPGTGDEPLTVAQTIPDARALIVTTPQEVSLADVRKSINFCRQVNMEILGLVENMSGLVCPHCGEMIDLFKSRGGMMTAKKENLRLLATLPLEPKVVEGGDSGNLAFLEDESLPITKAFQKMVDEIVNLPGSKKAFVMAPMQSRKTEGKEDSEGKRVLVIPVAGGKLASHFGHCEEFAFVETHDGRIVNTSTRIPPAHEPGVLPRWVSEQGGHVVIAGGMGERAQELFRENGLEVIIGAPMDPPESIANQYLTGNLITGENVCDH